MSDITLFRGPPLEEGPLPAVLYLALSAHDSLHLDPYNQPAIFLQSSPLRVFSLTLPGHELLPPTEALRFWADEIQSGRDVIQDFIQKAKAFVDNLIQRQVIDATKLGVMGLSRGVFVAAHLAAAIPEISALLGFAPLTRLKEAQEFEAANVDPWDLTHLNDQLYNRAIRCYIGNRDTRVGTQSCFDWISSLAETAYQ